LSTPPGLADATSKRSAFAILFTTVFLDFLGFTIVLPYLFFYAQSLGGTPLEYGLLVTSYAIAQFAFTPLLGRFSDRYGRRRILLVSLLGSGISYFVFGIGGSILLLFVARFVGGAMGATVPVAQAYVADITGGERKEERLRYMGLLSAAFGLGFIIGPAVGGILSSAYGYAVPSFVASALALSNLAVTYFRLPESRPTAGMGKRDEKGSTREPGTSWLTGLTARGTLGILFLLYFTTVLAFEFLDVTLAPWLQEAFRYGSLQVGLIFLYVGVILVVTQALLLPRFSKRLSPASLALIGLLIASASYLGLGVAQDVTAALAIGAVFSFGYALVAPSLNTVLSLSAGNDAQGSVMGVGQSLGSLAGVLAPALAAAMFSFGSSVGIDGLAFIVAAGVNTLGIPLLLASSPSIGRRSLLASLQLGGAPGPAGRNASQRNQA